MEIDATLRPMDALTALRLESLQRHLEGVKTSLEIGAFTRPTLQPPGFDAAFIDFYSTEELVAQHTKSGGRQSDVVAVDFVVRGEDYRPYVDRTFDIVIANHVLEHITNPIRWLVNIAELVNDSGLLFLSLPDKRYSFDTFRDETSLPHILSDFLIEGRDLQAEHCIETEILYDRAYIKRPRLLSDSLSLDRIKASAEKFHPGIHCHVFDGRHFENRILKPVIYMKLIPWSIVEYVPETRAGEFHIILRKGEPVTDLTEDMFFQHGSSS